MKSEPGENLKPRSQYIDEAIQLAIAGRWEEAAEVNRFLIKQFGSELPQQQREETNNRLGKALTELGQLEEARASYDATLGLNPLNLIARKNTAKLEGLLSARGEVRTGPARVDLNLFVEEMGKTVTTTLEDVVDPDLCTQVAPGDLAELRVEGDTILTETVRGVRLGLVEAKLARRLIKFIQGGNRYQAAVTSCEGTTVRLIIRETYQDARFAGRPSFPMRRKREVDFRPYAKAEGYLNEMDDFESESGEENDERTRGIDDLEGMHEVGDEGLEYEEESETTSEDVDEDL